MHPFAPSKLLEDKTCFVCNLSRTPFATFELYLARKNFSAVASNLFLLYSNVCSLICFQICAFFIFFARARHLCSFRSITRENGFERKCRLSGRETRFEKSSGRAAISQTSRFHFYPLKEATTGIYIFQLGVDGVVELFHAASLFKKRRVLASAEVEFLWFSWWFFIIKHESF